MAGANSPDDSALQLEGRVAGQQDCRRHLDRCTSSQFLLVRYEVAISTVIHELCEITLRPAASTLPRHAPLVKARCEALGTM
jgi:hypothetical protein